MFKSIGHFFATFFQKVLAVDKAVLSTETNVENATAAIPVYGPLGLTIEKSAYAILGEVAAVLTAGGVTATQSLTTAGVDPKILATVQDITAKSPTVTALAAAAPKAA